MVSEIMPMHPRVERSNWENSIHVANNISVKGELQVPKNMAETDQL